MDGERGGARRPAWHGDLDDLWPRFDDPRPGRPDRLPAEHPRQTGNRGADRARPRLSKAEIVDAAIAVADAEGAEALSMRRIAQVLRVGTMSLYWHVASKEHLLDLMRDALMAEVEVPEPSGAWRSDLRALAMSIRTSLARHSWMTDFVGGRPPLGPTTIRMLEASLALLTPLHLKPGTELDVLTALNTYVAGAVLRESQEIRAQQAEQAAIRQSSFEAVMRERDAWRDRIAQTGMFPNFVGFLDSRVDPDAPETRDARFEFGLDCLLDGIAARLGER
jgi:AcrR family transcriptional regulator